MTFPVGNRYSRDIGFSPAFPVTVPVDATLYTDSDPAQKRTIGYDGKAPPAGIFGAAQTMQPLPLIAPGEHAAHFVAQDTNQNGHRCPNRHLPCGALFGATFREYGLPQVIRADNGTPFVSPAPGGLSRLSLPWVKLGIVPVQARLCGACKWAVCPQLELEGERLLLDTEEAEGERKHTPPCPKCGQGARRAFSAEYRRQPVLQPPIQPPGLIPIFRKCPRVQSVIRNLLINNAMVFHERPLVGPVIRGSPVQFWPPAPLSPPDSMLLAPRSIQPLLLEWPEETRDDYCIAA